MAQQTHSDASTETKTVSVTVRYTKGAYADDVEGPEPGTEAFEIARDLRCSGADAFVEFDRDPQHAVETATETVSEAEIEIGADASPVDVASNVHDRMLGPRTDEDLDYDGSRMRSMNVGDVVIVDGSPIMVDRVGFEYVNVDTDEL